MQTFTFPATPAGFPRPFDPKRLEIGLGNWEALARNAPEDRAAFVPAFARDPAGRALLEAVFGNSPYLTRVLLMEPDFMARLAHSEPGEVFAALRAELAAAPEDCDRAEIMRRLRVFKRRGALLIALADLAETWTIEQVTREITVLAEDCLRHALRWLLRDAHRRGELVLPHPEDPEKDCALFILAMGKMGGGELNYSSDIDLIVFYDRDKADYRGKKSPGECFVALTRTLVQLFEDRTADGYVFRVDLRLRPDPGATPVALSTESAEIYYETQGQNWERAAMIKARPVAGDQDAACAFLAHLRPFIWRKYLDFNALQDIHSIKRQIHAVRGGAAIAVAGHNIKLGRGGIREVEFFAQTQQLIWGGRDPSLRQRSTRDAMAALVAAGLVTEGEADALMTSYWRLRRLEHRLQMLDDEQTQTLPADPLRLEQVAVFDGFDTLAAFETHVRETLGTVESHYAGLFEHAPSLSAGEGNLVFTGHDEDPGTLETLQNMGYRNPRAVADMVREWHHGRCAATRSPRAREYLTELVPALLRAFCETAQPDTALVRFGEFLTKLPAGVQIFSLLEHNRSLLTLVAEIMGDAPRLAGYLARNPDLLDAILAPHNPDRKELARLLDLRLRETDSYEEVLILLRRWANDARFRVGLMTLQGNLDADAAGRSLSDIADVALSALLPRVKAEFARAHGRVPGGEVALLAFGKLGSREMTAGSDLDLIVIYDVPPDSEGSDGERPLDPARYYTRLTQRLVNAITAMTGDGPLYEVDLRLRPSGNKGPLATSLDAFVRYQSEGAWTWENLALTRARVVCGAPRLKKDIEAAIRATLTRERDPVVLARDVLDMRALMDREKPPASLWDVKLAPGGLVDIEFVAQFVQLRFGAAHPGIMTPETRETLARCGRLGLIPPAAAERLVTHYGRCLAIQSTLRHSLSGPPGEDDLSPGLKAKLCRATGEPSFATLTHTMEQDSHAVRELFYGIVRETPEYSAPRTLDGKG
ncbi:bifunctional [glutamine synthetase] adenylyltransferase/[glutamine synthetase]-adenylyl-L-tyrosine phosphorylase [Phaeovibrio sulfidiphilus]|uniref:bifunctional [glutamine synthetase] adenylyltransferase/[glutamine synthetase]-adenylyl-L-tyrosine phosphorylase n=1 Tax=Phaeovibrio sulfidiphilus TaxID=1220600 RepID=UPI00308416D6